MFAREDASRRSILPILRRTGSMTKAIEKSVGRALLVTARLHRSRMGERLNGLGLFPGQEQALKALQEAPMTMGELAALLRVKPPTVSKTIGRLSLQGLVTREGGNRDGRLVQVALTEEGRKTAAELDAVWNAVEEELLDKLDGKERKQLRKLLRKAAKGLSKAGAEPDESDADLDEAENDA
jgi:DNA-binding MarR family transcriptional regulator